MAKMSKDEIKFLLEMLYNYRVNFAKAIKIHNEIANNLDKLQIVFVETDSNISSFIDYTSLINLNIIEKTTNLSMVNNKLLKAKNLEEITKLIVKEKILDLDKDIITTIKKQQKFYETCKERGVITSQTNNVFQQLNASLNNLYLTSMTQIKICEDCLNYALATYDHPPKDMEFENPFPDEDKYY